MSCAALGLGVLLLLLLTGDKLLGDPDTQWHIAVGRWIVANGTVPRTDIFSYTYAGAPWIAKEWVSQLLLYLADATAGWNGVVLLTALALAGTFVALFAWLNDRMRGSVALALTAGAFLMGEPHMLARPHALVLPVIAGWTMVLVVSLERRRAPAPWAALLMVVWANMHGSFPLGLVLASVLAGEGVLAAPAIERVRACRGWALFLALSVAATMLSPFGWRSVAVPLMMFGNGGTLRFVDEWQPLGLDASGVIALLMLAATTAVLLAEARANAFRLIATGLLAFLMIRHVRFICLFGLVSPMLCARTLAARLPALPVAPIPRTTALAASIALGVLFSTDALLAATLRPQPSARMTPSAAFAAMEAHGIPGPVFNDYDFGGFLIAHDVRTFVDGRTDQLFLGDFLPDLDRAVDDPREEPFADLVAKAGARWALVRPDSKTSAHFDAMPGWSRLFADRYAAAYVRD